MKILLIVRTHRADPETLAAFERYSALRSIDVIIGCDERRGGVDTGFRPKVGFDAGVLERLGLFNHPKCGWRCGDYFYYVARAAMPDYDFYWLVEPDVIINSADLNDTFDALNATTADLLAPHFGPRDDRWGWHRTMRESHPDLYGCIFPITRLSARAVDHLHAARRSAPIPETRAALGAWPNDEAFVATELQHHGFTCQELGHNVPGCYTRDTLRTGTPWDLSTLTALPPDGRIYHPARHFAAWFEEQSAWAASYAVSRRGQQPAFFRADHNRLVRLADAALSVEAFYHAALFPLMLASRMKVQARYEAISGEPDSYIEEEISPDRAIRTLRRRFGLRGNRRALATSHLLVLATHDLAADFAEPTDFQMDEPEPLYHPPTAFAIAYAYDLSDLSLLLTVHPLPSAILSADSMLEEQRRQACVACRVELRHLHRFYPPAAVELPAISFLLINDEPARVEAVRRLRSAGTRAVADPTALMQIAKQSDRFLGLPRRWQRTVLWSAIAPIFVTYGAAYEAVVLVVSGDILSIRDPLRALLADVQFSSDVDSVGKGVGG